MAGAHGGRAQEAEEQIVEVQVASEKEVARRNLSVQRYRGASRATAIEALQLPAEVDVGKLAEAVRNGFAAGSKSSNGHMGCKWDLGQGRALEVRGYGRYGMIFTLLRPFSSQALQKRSSRRLMTQ